MPPVLGGTLPPPANNPPACPPAAARVAATSCLFAAHASPALLYPSVPCPQTQQQKPWQRRAVQYGLYAIWPLLLLWLISSYPGSRSVLGRGGSVTQQTTGALALALWPAVAVAEACRQPTSWLLWPGFACSPAGCCCAAEAGIVQDRMQDALGSRPMVQLVGVFSCALCHPKP